MSFLNIEDEALRKRMIKRFLTLKECIKKRNREEREGYQDYRQALDKRYEPVVASHK